MDLPGPGHQFVFFWIIAMTSYFLLSPEPGNYQPQTKIYQMSGHLLDEAAWDLCIVPTHFLSFILLVGCRTYFYKLNSSSFRAIREKVSVAARKKKRERQVAERYRECLFARNNSPLPPYQLKAIMEKKTE